MKSALAGVAKHVRNRLRAADINAKCKCYVSCGTSWIAISTPTYEYEFTPAEQIEICTIAKVNGLTLANGYEINIHRETYCKGQHFEVPSSVLTQEWAAIKAGVKPGEVYAAG